MGRGTFHHRCGTAAPGRFRRPLALALALVCAALPATAEAGRRPYFWTWDTETVPERGAEIETWLTERFVGAGIDQAQVWTAPIVGLTDRLELAIPFEWTYWEAKKATQYDWYGAELRLRLTDPDRDVAGPWGVLVRVAVHRPVRVRDELRFEGNLVASRELGARCRATADLGYLFLKSGIEHTLTYAAGASCQVAGEFRLGSETFGEVFVASPVDQPALTMAGPNLAHTHGRFWLSGGVLFGVTAHAPAAMSRLIWAIAF